jgi:hypothetical protein
MSKRDPIGKTKAARGDADLSPRWREAVDELGKLRDALAAGEPVENHFRADVVAPDPAFSELLAALRLERERLGLSLGEVARRTGLDTGDLSRKACSIKSGWTGSGTADRSVVSSRPAGISCENWLNASTCDTWERRSAASLGP